MAYRDRRRAAAVIIHDGRVLMVRERGVGATGRHDGQEYWTLPGGGIEPDETPEQAVIREVAEEVGLTALSARYLYDAPHPAGWTACYSVRVKDGEPRLGIDDDLHCDCPRMVGLDWVSLPRIPSATSPLIIPTLLMGTLPT